VRKHFWVENCRRKDWFLVSEKLWGLFECFEEGVLLEAERPEKGRIESFEKRLPKLQVRHDLAWTNGRITFAAHTEDCPGCKVDSGVCYVQEMQYWVDEWKSILLDEGARRASA
jgi:hypothetical protein